MTRTACACMKAMAASAIVVVSCGPVQSGSSSSWIFDVERPSGSARVFLTVKDRSPDKDAPLSLRVIEANIAEHTSRPLLTVADDIHEMTGTKVSPDGLRIAVVSTRLRIFGAKGDLPEEFSEGDLLEAFSDGRPSRVVTWSPDSSRLAMAVSWGPGYPKSLMLWSPGPDATRRILANDLWWAGVVEWSPDGEQIMFATRNPSEPDPLKLTLVTQDVSSGERKEVASGVTGCAPTALWRPNSDTILWLQEGESDRELWVRDVAAPRARLAARLRGFVGRVRWSPDGEWLAFNHYLPTGGEADKCPHSASILPAEVILKSDMVVDVEPAAIRIWEPGESEGVSYDWNASGELLYTGDKQVLKAFDPRTRKSRFVLALLPDGGITFTPPEAPE